MTSVDPEPPAPTRLDGVRAVTLDFGNTLVPVSRAALREVAARTAANTASLLGLTDLEAVRVAWDDERLRQLREDVPRMKEMDIPQRAVRVIARLRGVGPPPPDEPWDDAVAAGASRNDEVEAVVEAYSQAFLDLVPPAAGAAETIAELAVRGFRVGILSNWPLATTIDRYAVAAGWDVHLAAIVVSQRVGVIKPDPAIFATAAEALHAEPAAILHVGDDWAADVVGARGAGFRVAYLRGHQDDTPLPTSVRGTELAPDLELDRLAELPSRLADPRP